MTYTLWHSGIRIGETMFEQTHGRQKLGVFRPTTYGLEIFPRLSGVLSAASRLKEEMSERGLSEADAIENVGELIETTEGGRAMIELGRTLIDVELHDPKGKRLEFTSIAFSDLVELRSLCRKLGTGSVPDDAEIPADGPRYLVSVTLGKSPIPHDRFGMTSRDN